MKKLMMILCTILCANILAAQTQFTVGGLKYEVIDNNSVEVAQQNSSAISGSVVIPSTVTYIGTTYSVTSIGNGAFSDCSGLTSVSIPNSVTYIGEYAFLSCSGLTSVTIGNSVTSIGDYAFLNCSGLTSINVASGNTHYSSIDGVLYNYVQDTLIQCPGAKTSVTIPNSVTSIGGGAFAYCSGLTSVTIGNSLTSIGYSAFYECINLSSLISLATVPPTIGNEAFPYPNICTVTVPCGSLAAYTASTCYWSVYFHQRITESSSFELSVSANEEAYGRVEVENHSCESKTLTAIANDGYEFTSWNDGNTENPRTVTITSDTAFMAIFTASGSSSLQEVNAREFALYPNPAKSFVNLEFEALKENTLLQILDINGRRVRTFDLKAGQETLQINVSELPKGVYTIMLGNTAKKLIVE